jgi:preprotein translocase subunit SecG
MAIFISILIVIVALILVLIVVIQNSKGGGLAAGFASSNQVMGVRKTTDFLEKTTWYLAGAMVALCVIYSLIPRQTASLDSGIKDVIQNTQTQDPTTTAPFGTAIPAENQEIPEE